LREKLVSSSDDLLEKRGTLVNFSDHLLNVRDVGISEREPPAAPKFSAFTHEDAMKSD
jgi:hypothetical protein